MDNRPAHSPLAPRSALLLSGDLRSLRAALDAHRGGPLVLDLSDGKYRASIISYDLPPQPVGEPAELRDAAITAHRLSEREVDILALLAQGHSNAEISETLYLSVNTVKTYLRTAYRKVGLTSRPHAVAWAVQHGFAAGEEPPLPARDGSARS